MRPHKPDNRFKPALRTSQLGCICSSSSSSTPSNDPTKEECERAGHGPNPSARACRNAGHGSYPTEAACSLAGHTRPSAEACANAGHGFGPGGSPECPKGLIIRGFLSKYFKNSHVFSYVDVFFYIVGFLVSTIKTFVYLKKMHAWCRARQDFNYAQAIQQQRADAFNEAADANHID